jgi:predicted nucleic acid-binding protein
VSFLLDTHVVSEWTKVRPDPGVVAWLAEVDEDRVFISVVTLAELCYESNGWTMANVASGWKAG